MSKSILNTHRKIWENKPALRVLYFHWYTSIIAQLKPGRILEVGGGSGNLKEYAPKVICTDIVEVPWLDVVADAQNLPFNDSIFANIVLFDVLHHIENPAIFFKEAIRLLTPGGKIIIMDPYISLFSWPVYHFFHSEAVDLSQNPLTLKPFSDQRKPFDANQAISKLLFEKHFISFKQHFPELRMILKKYLSYFAYPLSGGFDHPSLIPSTIVSLLLKFEQYLQPFGRFLAFRILLVFIKVKDNSNNY